jgi:hypothetical protein
MDHLQKTKSEGTELLPVSLHRGMYYTAVETAKGRKCVKVVVE